MRTVIVTGGTKGIGLSIVKTFLAEGDAVYAVYNSDEGAADKLREAGYENLTVRRCGVSRFDEVEALYNDVYRERGAIDVSVHSAGVEISKLLAMITPEEWDRIISVNLNGVYNCCRCAVKKMLSKENGRIINISSAAATFPLSGQAAYAASKAGVNALTKALAKETARFGITVNAVAPGYTTGEMADKYYDKMVDKIPMKRFAEPQETAALVKFLASGDAGYITGAVYAIDGGLGV